MGATTFEGTTFPVDAKLWINLVEKCFGVMQFPEDKKVGLDEFLLQKGVEDYWKMTESRKGTKMGRILKDIRG